MQDKRRCLRYEVDMPTTFKVFAGQRHVSVATSLNVSAKGLCLMTTEKLAVGQKLKLQVKTPSGETLALLAKVVWVQEKNVMNRKEFIIGVELDDQMSADEAKFVKFCADIMLDNYYKNKKAQEDKKK